MKRFKLSFGMAVLLLLGATVWAAVPQLVNFQGILKDGSGNPVADGSYSVIFTIYDDPAAGAVLWAETTSVSTTSGLFSVLLGSLNPVPDSAFNNPNRYLGIKVGADPEMLPRQQLVSLSYAYRVNSVDGATGGTISSKVSIGPGHTNTGTNAFVAGISNTAGGNESAVGGGTGNNASGYLGTIAGGYFNQASGTGAFIGGGSSNVASGLFNSFVGGGFANQASGQDAAIGGGNINIASGLRSFLGGGSYNKARGEYSTVGGGGGPTAADSNSALGNWAVIGGGRGNGASGSYSSVNGGNFNYATGSYATVGGGNGNTATDQFATVGGGAQNYATGQKATISGGTVGRARGMYSVVCGGGGSTPFDSNAALGDWSIIGGGRGNHATNFFATVSGGDGNTASGDRSTVGGGDGNTASGFLATVPGGKTNTAAGSFSFAAGRRAKANHAGAFVWADGMDADFASTSDNQFLIRASGGVGIGIDAPTAKLQAGSVGSEGTPAFIAGTQIAAQATNPDNWAHMAIISGSFGQSRLNFGDGANDDQGSVAYNNTNDAMFFITAAAERMRITSTGNVGIGTTSPASRLQVNGALATAVTAVSVNTVLNETQSVVLASTPGVSDIVVTLPTAVGIAGRQYTIKKADAAAHTVIIDANGAETIDGAFLYNLVTQNKYVTLVSNGANWFVIANN